AGLQLGQPVLTMPIKVHLQNPFLGSTCYIGSDSDPIVLRPANTVAGTFSITRFNASGAIDAGGAFPRLDVIGGSQADTTFAVPGARGCGVASTLDTAINLKEGLPSPSGNNSLVLTGASTYAATLADPRSHYPNAGWDFSDGWHSAVCPCPTPTPTATATPLVSTPTALATLPAGCAGDTDCDGCPDLGETQLHPPPNPADPWDFYSVPVPSLLALPDPAGVIRDSAVVASDAQAVFSYFRRSAKS